MSKIPVGLQIWSIRNDASKDPIGTLKAVKEMGYDGIELFNGNYCGMPASELSKIVKELGLKVSGSHVGWGDLENNLDAVIAYMLEVGATYAVCPGAPGDKTQDAAGWRWFAGAMSEVAEKCAAKGLTVGYHNHDWEFRKMDGKFALDVFFEAADPSVIAELDLGWVLHAGVNPVEYLRQYTGRCPLVHIKDFVENGPQTEIGTGSLPLADIIKAAPEAGVKWHVIEVEEYNMPPVDSVRVSLQNMRAILGY